MYTNDYDFAGINAIKIILLNSDGKVLLVQEPETNAWMPLHWGLPGGKSTNKEGLIETFERKGVSDVGRNLEMKGLFKIVELLQDKRTVMMYIVVAETHINEVFGEAKKYKWVDLSEIQAMDLTEFTEYYNKDLLIEYLSGDRHLVDPKIIRSLPYYSMADDPEYSRWLDSGIAK